MISIILVLVIIVGTINVLNYRGIVSSADRTLLFLQYYGDMLPLRDGRLEFGGGGFYGGGFLEEMSPELPYQARYFMVVLTESGAVLEVNTESIAAVDAAEAVEMASHVLEKGKTSGFSGDYRYLCREDVFGTQVIFLDCARELSTVRNFLLASVGTSVAGILAVWIMLILLSSRFVKPVSESYEKQKRFITDAGHEIKTPITIIDADTELLEMDLAENEWLQDIRLQTKRLTDLTNELIYLSRMDEEQTKLQTIEFPLSDMVGEIAASFQALAITNNQIFQSSIEPMLSVNAEEKSLRQLVSILLDNAVKYTPEGGRIDLHLRRNGKTVSLTVSNTTEGVERGDMAHLFDRFYRGDRSRNSSTGGYGLGLSIAYAVVQAHRGKITASSPDGIQMVIEVQIPVNLA